MMARADGRRRPELGEVLREPTTPAALLDAVRDRMIGARQREHRAPESTAALIRERLPELAARTIADADRALAGLLILPGTGAQPYFVGDPPDWLANPVNDNEFLWVLNRHGHWRNLLAAEAVHHNYEPAIHRRMVALVGGAFLLVLDQVRAIGPERTVQIFYHLDASDVTWDADRRMAITANPDVNVAIFASPNVWGTLLEGGSRTSWTWRGHRTGCSWRTRHRRPAPPGSTPP